MYLHERDIRVSRNLTSQANSQDTYFRDVQVLEITNEDENEHTDSSSNSNQFADHKIMLGLSSNKIEGEAAKRHKEFDEEYVCGSIYRATMHLSNPRLQAHYREHERVRFCPSSKQFTIMHLSKDWKLALRLKLEKTSKTLPQQSIVSSCGSSR